MIEIAESENSLFKEMRKKGFCPLCGRNYPAVIDGVTIGFGVSVDKYDKIKCCTRCADKYLTPIRELESRAEALRNRVIGLAILEALKIQTAAIEGREDEIETRIEWIDGGLKNE